MAEAVAETLATHGKLVVEAGTGTGKTFAYLLPALLCGRKTIISTGTKALQDQLYHRDLPLIGKAVGRPISTALLKGRANYLCLQRLEQLTEPADSIAEDAAAVREWRHRTATGDRAEQSEVSEDSAIWPLVTSTTENCHGQKCPFFDDCHVVRARRSAQEADLVVVNHHLLLADLAFKEAGFVEFLPGAEAFILDEAHQIPDLAVQFFGVGIGTRDIERVIDDVRAATLAIRQAELDRRIDALQTAVRELRAAAPRSEGRHQLDELMADLRPSLDALHLRLDELRDALLGFTEATIAIDKCAEQLAELIERLTLAAGDDVWDGLRWVEINPRSLRLNVTPLDVSSTLHGLIDNPDQAWIFTSATLAVGEDFSHFTSRMGLINATGLTFPSPFPIEANGLVYLPPNLPPPSEPGHTQAVLEAVAPLLKLTDGGVFLLFTSHRALKSAKLWFRANTARLHGRTLLAQGTAPRDDLLRRFRDIGDAVLLGTGTFWEGVDVRGPALTVVAIDKLPFASPADPLMMAQLEFIRRDGGNGFFEHQVPQAVIALKQGAGRLLRDARDYGVVVICDPRILSKGYGQHFLDGLRPMRTTGDIGDVRRFFRTHEAKGRVA